MRFLLVRAGFFVGQSWRKNKNLGGAGGGPGGGGGVMWLAQSAPWF
jgi:hypothetical protein